MQQIVRLVDFVCSFTALISMIFSLHDFLGLLFDILYLSQPTYRLLLSDLYSDRRLLLNLLFQCLSCGVHLNVQTSD